MTERELFYGFYRVWRLRASADGDCTHLTQPGFDESYIGLVAAAARMGLSNLEIEWLAFESAYIISTRHSCRCEPSSCSAYIQMLFFTFGRVRRDA